MNGDQACFSDGNDLFRFPCKTPNLWIWCLIILLKQPQLVLPSPQWLSATTLAMDIDCTSAIFLGTLPRGFMLTFNVLGVNPRPCSSSGVKDKAILSVCSSYYLISEVELIMQIFTCHFQLMPRTLSQLSRHKSRHGYQQFRWSMHENTTVVANLLRLWCVEEKDKIQRVSPVLILWYNVLDVILIKI